MSSVPQASVLSEIVSDKYSALLSDKAFADSCRHILDRDGVLVLHDFLQASTLRTIQQESMHRIEDAYFCVHKHNVYLTPENEDFPTDHVRNRRVVSSKGLISDDQISPHSPLKLLYNNQVFRSFVSKIVQQEKLYPYADPLSAVNVHFHKDGQELGWHFDNSDFAVTILIQKPSQGGVFEYVSNIRDDQQEHTLVEQILNQERTPQQLNMQEGSLVIFRGRRSLHRVTPSRGSVVRLVAVLAYNAQPGVKLSESARETFYGRLE